MQRTLGSPFWAAAVSLAGAELLALLSWQNGIACLWDGPNPWLAFLSLPLRFALMVFVGLGFLWLRERNLKRFLVVTTAAASVIPGALMSAGVTAHLLQGNAIPLIYIPISYGMFAIAIGCIMQHDHMLMQESLRPGSDPGAV